MAPVILVGGFFLLYKETGNYWIWLIILLCPLSHILMMSGRKNSDICKKEQGYKCSECGLKYKEKEWAEKCETWCKKYKSCNLEIIKHAINKSKKL